LEINGGMEKEAGASWRGEIEKAPASESGRHNEG
jgi:hypothetical protein